jgi:putative addiction module killer protein
MIDINQTQHFRRWLHKLKDPLGKVGILARIKRAQSGNFGDHKILPNTAGIYEMRIFKGNGYRVYYAKQGDTVYLLLLGGSKDSQQSDIDKACTLWQQVKNKTKEYPHDR